MKLVVALLTVNLAACAMQSEKSLQNEILGSWRIEMIKSRGVVDRSPATIQFNTDNKYSGNSSCNRYFGSYESSGNQVSFSAGGSTRMACHEALMEQEQRMLSALSEVRSGRIENGLLYLEAEDGALVYRASQVSK